MKPLELSRLHPFFSSLTEADALKLLRQTRCRRFAAGEEVFHKDDPGDGFYGVLSGSVAFTVDSVDGKELTLNVLGPGEFFGEIALLRDMPRTATVTATDDSRLYALERADFLAAVTGHSAARAVGQDVVDTRLRPKADASPTM